MFTGIVEELGEVVGRDELTDAARLVIRGPVVTADAGHGDSIAVNGVCLTVVEVLPDGQFSADVMAETLERSSLRVLDVGSRVNLERAAALNSRLGGHIVQGHVDGTGDFLGLERIPGADDFWLRIEIPPELARYVIFKGSLCIEGISLTVARIEGTKVTAAIIPHTVKMTNLKSLKAGDPVNLEVDMVAKYVEKMLKGESANSSFTVERLVQEGF
ncbi:MAG: riboflavin synthase [Terriglobales bacterium]